MPRPMSCSRRWNWASRSTHSVPPCTSETSGIEASRWISAPVASGVDALARGVTSSEAGSGFGSMPATAAWAPSSRLSRRSASAFETNSIRATPPSDRIRSISAPTAAGAGSSFR